MCIYGNGSPIYFWSVHTFIPLSPPKIHQQFYLFVMQNGMYMLHVNCVIVHNNIAMTLQNLNHFIAYATINLKLSEGLAILN